MVRVIYIDRIGLTESDNVLHKNIDDVCLCYPVDCSMRLYYVFCWILIDVLYQQVDVKKCS